MKKGRSFILFCQSFSYQPETGKNFRLLHPAEKKAAGFLTHFKLIIVKNQTIITIKANSLYAMV